MVIYLSLMRCFTYLPFSAFCMIQAITVIEKVGSKHLENS